ncbi:MBL fold metallo-hydrolase [Spirulina sp. 06S082]|uniref:MBL fold metallo-hydrolase n=1 Tax=Spirulina sp. 06S082 TaxID=3110248 RepID=UPI002B1F5115|nr:MBL fold metallo-hydrolase [Spirulina sp. 06S082]MEA5471662.1 MBL fold metallo-hydrolase [Spirulina sp. 06S082]
MPPDTQPAAVNLAMPNTDVQEESLAVSFDVQFWGVRDQIATPGKNTIRYGGNTSCVEMRVGKQSLIFDGGTGLRILGNHLLSRMPIESHIFFTHCHWDRIQGFPFFVPAFIPINHFHIYGATASNGSSFQQRLSKQMLGPNFPVPIQVMQSKLDFYDLEIEEKQCVGNDIIIENMLLNHHHRSVGYRVACLNKSVVYAMSSDYSLETNSPNAEKLLKLADKADLLILASPRTVYRGEKEVEQISPEFDKTWKFCISLAKEASVKEVMISLHNPDHSDDYLDRIDKQLKEIFPKASLASEGMVVSI